MENLYIDRTRVLSTHYDFASQIFTCSQGDTYNYWNAKNIYVVNRFRVSNQFLCGKHEIEVRTASPPNVYAATFIFENIVFDQSGNNNTHFASGGWQYQSDYGDFDSNNNYNGGYFGREIGKNYLYAFEYGDNTPQTPINMMWKNCYAIDPSGNVITDMRRLFNVGGEGHARPQGTEYNKYVYSQV